MKVPFFRPQIGDQEIAKVVDVLRNGWLTSGPMCQQFERDFADFIGDEVQAVAVNSATAALHLGLEAMGVVPGDQVIVPTLTFTATAEVVRILGADPVFVDVDPGTFTLDMNAVEQAITPATKVIMPVHFAGQCCDTSALKTLADDKGLMILDDAAHALPTESDLGRIGSTGFTATAFSFYANKTMTTGEGGMLLSSDEDLIERARTMRLHGINRDVFNRFTDLKASWQYDVVAAGFKYNMTDLAAAIGTVQLPRCLGFADDRRRLAKRYHSHLGDLPLILPEHPNHVDHHCWHLYIVRLTDQAPLDRNATVAKLQEAGIGVSVHYTPLHEMTFWKETYSLDPQHFPNANKIFETCISLPLYPSMSVKEQDHVISTLHNLLKI